MIHRNTDVDSILPGEILLFQQKIENDKKIMKFKYFMPDFLKYIEEPFLKN